jgi:hypothetical protein
MSLTLMAQKQMALAETAQGNTAHRFTNLYSLSRSQIWLGEQKCRPARYHGSSSAKGGS